MSNKNQGSTHRHQLEYMNACIYYMDKRGKAMWKCDVCGRNAKESGHLNSYHCSACSFDACADCIEPLLNPKHEHTLNVTDMTTVPNYPGGWTCDNCSTDSKTLGEYSFRCGICSYDLCYGCTRAAKSNRHEHLMRRIYSKKAYPLSRHWSCFRCRETWWHDEEERPFSCAECKLNLCNVCMNDTLEEIIADVVEQPASSDEDEDEDESEKADANVKQPELKPTQTNLPKPSDKKKASSSKESEKDEGKHSVFISYQWDSQGDVIQLRKTLEAGDIKCWMDIGCMGGGDNLKKEIDKGMRDTTIVISCVTKAYSKSKACQQEVALADVLGKPIVPVLMEAIPWPPEGPMSMPLAPLLYIDYKDPQCSDRFEKVLQRVSTILEKR